jgi:hypothetical protein
MTAPSRARGYGCSEAFASAKQLPTPGRCHTEVMLFSAIVFGAVGVAAGFTWDYVVNRGK